MNISEQLNQVVATLRRTVDKAAGDADLAPSRSVAKRTAGPRWQFNFQLDGTLVHGVGALRFGGVDSGCTTGSVTEGDERIPAELRTENPSTHYTDESLANRVDASLRRFLEVETIHHDDDGAVRIRSGEAAVFVRVLPEEELVSVVSPVLCNIKKSPSLLRAVNDMNGELRLARAVISGSGVFLVAEVPGGTEVDVAVPLACDTVAQASNKWGQTLRDRFGGRTFFGENESQEEPDDPEEFRPGTYL